MRLYTTAESVHLEQDERGFDLRVTTVDGDDFLFNIQDVAFEFARSPELGALLNAAMATAELHSVCVDKWPGQ